MSYQISKNERKHKFKAVLVTITICTLAFGAIAMQETESLQEYLPDTVAEWLLDAPAADTAPVEEVVTTGPRP